MNWAATTATPGGLSENQRVALIKLLGDEDPAVYTTVRDKIISFGPPAAEWLRPLVTNDEPFLRRRAQAIVLHFDREAADDRFLSFCLNQGQGCDLEQGAWLLAQTRFPHINPQGYQAMLDAYAATVTERLGPDPQPSDSLTALNHCLFESLGFCGNEENYYDPENSYLNRVLDRRTGNPVNLCLLYILISRRLNLPVTGIGLPGHFLCRYQSSAAEIYIDAFNRGKFLTKGDCIQYLLHGSYSLREDYLSPISPRKMLLRICANLHQIYLHLDRTDEATRLQRYLVALGRT